MSGNRNRTAADLIRRMRIDQGLTPEALAYAIARENVGTVSGRTIRRIETEGAVPSVRVQFAIAKHFDRLPSDIWPPSSRSSLRSGMFR